MPNVLRRFCQPTDVYSSQRPLFIALFIAGFFPFTVAGKKQDKRLKLSFIGLGIAIFHVTLFAFSIGLTLKSGESFVVSYYPSAISKIGYFIEILISIATIALIYISCMCGLSKIRECLEILADIDGKLNLLGVEINYLKGFKFNICCITGFMVLNFVFSITAFVMLLHAKPKDMPGWSLWASYFQSPLAVTMIVIYYMCILYEIKQRFAGLNQILSGICQPNDVKQYLVGRVIIPDASLNRKESISLRNRERLTSSIADPFNILEDTFIIHDKLCDLCSIVEDYFGLKMMTVATIAVIIIIFNGFHVIELIFSKDFTDQGHVGKSKRYLTILLFQICKNFLEIICIGQSSHITENQYDKCSDYVHKIMNQNCHNSTQQKLIEFSLQLFHRKINFGALSLIPLNRAFISIVVNTTVTYLLVLLDFAL